MDKPEQRVVFSKKYDEQFVNTVKKHQIKGGFASFKAALIALANKGLNK